MMREITRKTVIPKWRKCAENEVLSVRLSRHEQRNATMLLIMWEESSRSW